MRFGLVFAVLTLSCGLSGSPPSSKAADESDSQISTFDETLTIQDGDNSVELKSSSSGKAYLVVVNGDTESSGTFLGGDTQTMVVPKDDLEKITIYRLDPIAGWRADLGSRACDEGPVLCPLPPPPPPDWKL